MAESKQTPEQTHSSSLPEWNLILSREQPYTLDLSVFRSRDGERIARRPADFRWTRVIYALTILLVQLKEWSHKGKPGEWVMEGRKHSPAAALAGAQPKDKRDVIGGLKKMFGKCANNLSTVWNHIQVCERDKRWKGKRTWVVTARGLSPASVHIFLGELAYKEGRELTSGELDAVVDDLCRNWKGGQILPSRAPDEAPSGSPALRRLTFTLKIYPLLTRYGRVLWELVRHWPSNESTESARTLWLKKLRQHGKKTRFELYQCEGLGLSGCQLGLVAQALNDAAGNLRPVP